MDLDATKIVVSIIKCHPDQNHLVAVGRVVVVVGRVVVVAVEVVAVGRVVVVVAVAVRVQVKLDRGGSTHILNGKKFHLVQVLVNMHGINGKRYLKSRLLRDTL